MADQGSPPRRSARQPGTGHHGRAEAPERAARPRREAPWREYDPFAPDDDELPPWAGPSVYQYREPGEPAEHRGNRYSDDGVEPAAGAGAGRAIRRHGRAAQARLRKSRRRVYWRGGVAIVACVVAAGIAILVTQPSPKPKLPYVTQLLPGEYKAVPDSCTAVSNAVLNTYLPTTGRIRTQTASGSGESQCSFTVDHKPDFLVLEVTAQMFQPFAAASGDGSASDNALDNFQADKDNLAHPPKHSPLPSAQISTLTGTGQRAFMAFQAEHVRGVITDVVTEEIQERNVVVTVELQGQESGHGFGPVSPTAMEAAARRVASSMLAKVKTEPTA